MQVKKIAFFECDSQRSAFFSRHFPDCDLKFFAEPLGTQHLVEIADCQIVFVLNYSQVTREIVEQLKETRLITAGATGCNNIDIGACREHGIAVSNTPGYSDDTVAEYTLTLMLMLLRHVHTAFLRARNNQFVWQGLQGRTLKGKTLGIIGTGKIGLKVMELVQGFGMRLLAYSRNPKPDQAEALGFTYAPLTEVLAGSDILSLHLTANAQTYHLLDREKLALCKRGAVLINTSRGEVLDTKALIWALDQGILSGAALDVLEAERLCQENRLLQPGITAADMENYALNQHLLHREDVLITPHIGWFTQEAVENMLSLNLTNIRSFMTGKPTNLVLHPAGT